MWLSEVIPAPLEFRYVDGRRLGLATLADAQNMTALSNGTIVVASASGQGLQFVADPHLKKES